MRRSQPRFQIGLRIDDGLGQLESLHRSGKQLACHIGMQCLERVAIAHVQVACIEQVTEGARDKILAQALQRTQRRVFERQRMADGNCRAARLNSAANALSSRRSTPCGCAARAFSLRSNTRSATACPRSTSAGKASGLPRALMRAGITSKSQPSTCSRTRSISALRVNAERACPSHCARSSPRSRPLASGLPLLVLQHETHVQVHWKLDADERRGIDHDAGGAHQEFRQGRRQVQVARHLGLDKGTREIRRWHEVAAQGLAWAGRGSVRRPFPPAGPAPAIHNAPQAAH